MKKLSVKSKIIIQTLLGLFFSIVIYVMVMVGCERAYKFAAENKIIVILMMILSMGLSICVTNQLVDVKQKAEENGQLLLKVLTLINNQVILFSIIYLCMDLLFDNPYIKIAGYITNHSVMANIGLVALIITIFVLCKKIELKKQVIISSFFVFVLIIQLNYLEIVFLGTYFFICFISSKILNVVIQRKKTYNILMKSKKV